MRLWQKIFLLTLCLTALAANSIALVLLVRNQANSLSLAKERVRAICNGAVAELGHLVQEKREAEGCLLVTETELEKMLSDLRLDHNGGLITRDTGRNGEAAGENRIAVTPVAWYSEETETICTTSPEEVGSIRTMLLEKVGSTGTILSAEEESVSTMLMEETESIRIMPPEEAGSISTMLSEENGKRWIRAGTTVFLEGGFYRVEVSSNVTGLFEGFRDDLVFSQWMCGAVSLIIAAVLLLSILYLTKPLKRLETATKQIASGEYGYRVRVKGCDEIAELSGHMNEMAEEIEARIRQVEALARARETFIANMAHELKTPLTSILGFADIMTIKSNMEEPERREYAAIIAAEARRLKLLSSRLMELISIRETELELCPLDFGVLAERALDVFAPVCAERQCRIRKQLQSLQVEAEGALLTSLILNLLDNALKASDPGQEIELTLQKRDDKAELTVRDYGIGIPEAELDRVTEAFYMVDKARSRSSGGSGVGLALCRAVAEAHHGTLQIESREGHGTRVTVVLPCVG